MLKRFIIETEEIWRVNPIYEVIAESEQEAKTFVKKGLISYSTFDCDDNGRFLYLETTDESDINIIQANEAYDFLLSKYNLAKITISFEDYVKEQLEFNPDFAHLTVQQIID